MRKKSTESTGAPSVTKGMMPTLILRWTVTLVQQPTHFKNKLLEQANSKVTPSNEESELFKTNNLIYYQNVILIF